MFNIGDILIAKDNQNHIKGFTMQILKYNKNKTRYFVKIINGFDLYEKGEEITFSIVHKKWRRKNNYIKRLR